MVESVEPKVSFAEWVNRTEQSGRNTMGFTVSSAPLWLCKELSKESNKYYNDIFWPVIVDWYRKAKQMEKMMNGGIPEIEELPKVEVSQPEEKSVKLFGGQKGV